MSSKNDRNNILNKNEVQITESEKHECEKHECEIGGTQFIVVSHFITTAKETLVDKIARLIKNDATTRKDI